MREKKRKEEIARKRQKGRRGEKEKRRIAPVVAKEREAPQIKKTLFWPRNKSIKTFPPFSFPFFLPSQSRKALRRSKTAEKKGAARKRDLLLATSVSETEKERERSRRQQSTQNKKVKGENNKAKPKSPPRNAKKNTACIAKAIPFHGKEEGRSKQKSSRTSPLFKRRGSRTTAWDRTKHSDF